MAILHNKEQKIEVVLSKLPKKYTDAQFVEKFIQLYSKDWGKIKANYIKQSQDKEPGTVINMPKPDIYLKQILNNYLNNRTNPLPVKQQPAVVEAPVVEAPVAVAPVIDEKPEIRVKVAPKAKVAVKAKSAIEENTPAEKKATVKKATAVKATKVDKEVKAVKVAKAKA